MPFPIKPHNPVLVILLLPPPLLCSRSYTVRNEQILAIKKVLSEIVNFDVLWPETISCRNATDAESEWNLVYLVLVVVPVQALSRFPHFALPKFLSKVEDGSCEAM